MADALVPAATTGPTELLLAATRTARQAGPRRSDGVVERTPGPAVPGQPGTAGDGRLELERLTAREVNAVVLEWSRDRPRSAKE